MNQEIQTQDLKAEGITILQVANELVIKGSHDLEIAADHLTLVKKLKQTVTDRKEQMTRPLMKALSSTRELFKPYEDMYIQAEKTIKQKILAYEESLEEEKEIPLPSVDGMHIRTTQKVRVINAKLVPRAYLIPDMVAITRAVIQEGKKVKGTEKYEESVVVSR